MYVPHVTELTSRGERSNDLFSRLLQDRIVFIGTGIDNSYANVIIAQLLFLEADNPEKDIYVYINCPGGYIQAGLAVYDTMQFIRPDIRTICIGQAVSIASLILAAGTKGKRSSLPNSRIMMHQPIGDATGQASDIEIQANEILRVKQIVNSIYEKHTGKPAEMIERDIERDLYMTAEEAKNYGIIDNVFSERKS
ncbi:MAG TPA: ATP-dependent Clp protease proteolytic subunit [Leptospiraceae bacterium]|nr:ATP-dependent Clp protease proteolytic subunit [Leptospiraceae bacterium]HMY66924.1 ATP-dependent Clp protease proteolytic subunit [Leptospiraceae bacterium]HMZ61137.1 ATP-dependent Clp protease proteolytic subunit [Leptospiraceae bacterium]HNF14156.1 ATP-dependent Clp protease proteolytic subunit [Leptospiraceae bacterium]HNF24374.1 ATP-dependent Clp protease proteolytic subunit [Leptospiraceae bacterium]